MVGKSNNGIRASHLNSRTVQVDCGQNNFDRAIEAARVSLHDDLYIPRRRKSIGRLLHANILPRSYSTQTSAMGRSRLAGILAVSRPPIRRQRIGCSRLCTDPSVLGPRHASTLSVGARHDLSECCTGLYPREKGLSPPLEVCTVLPKRYLRTAELLLL